MGKAQQQELSNGDLSAENRKRKATEESGNSKRIKKDGSEEHYFIGDPVSMQKAHRRWPHRYPLKDGKGKKSSENDVQTNYARCHYEKCVVEGVEYKLNDSVYMKGEEAGPNYIGRLVELFEATTGEQFCTCQWFYRITDTVIRDQSTAHDGKRVFLSDVKDDNLLESIVMKLKIMHIDPVKEKKCIESCDYYYDLHYSPPYSTFARSLLENSGEKNSSPMVSSSGDGEKTLLDLYSGCGGMSTGLCMGAQLAGVNLTTRWAVDLDEHACESFHLNHPESRVRNEKVSDFLNLLMEWKTLCMKYGFLGKTEEELGTSDVDEVDSDDGVVPSGEFEVGRILGIRYGEKGLEFEVRWKGYGPDDDTWEPLGNLGKCDERIETFVRAGYLSKILPLPGDVDVICGGPPCQGISGFNRFRNKENPLDDPLNHQLVVFMDVVDFLKPKYILMENVVDILKFSNGLLGRYALGRLVNMKYQARLGLMAAGCYGVPQFRMRFFLWGAAASEELPQYPLPTHDVVVRGGIPNEFEQTLVAFNETEKPKLEKELLLGDAISDLPPVSNDINVDLMEYKAGPQTEFQRYIRLSKEALYNSGSGTASSNQKLYDHRPLQLNQDDHARVKQIPKKKGANFRDLRGVLLGPDNVVKWDPNVERVYLESGKPLVPDYAMSFVRGRSSKPFGRLWWDETVPTVVTRAEPHNQRILHPEQDRVLSIRENARLQGFPDYYQLQGPVKKRYMQIGNAVAVPVARALGYALGKAMLKDCGSSPLMTLPANFPLISKTIATSTGDKSESDVE